MRINVSIFFLCLFFGAGSVSFGLTVLGVLPDKDLVAVSVDEGTVWGIEERVCILKDWERAACGNIVKVGSKGIIILTTIHTLPLKQGEAVEVVRVENFL